MTPLSSIVHHCLQIDISIDPKYFCSRKQGVESYCERCNIRIVAALEACDAQGSFQSNETGPAVLVKAVCSSDVGLSDKAVRCSTHDIAVRPRPFYSSCVFAATLLQRARPLYRGEAAPCGSTAASRLLKRSFSVHDASARGVHLLRPSRCGTEPLMRFSGRRFQLARDSFKGPFPDRAFTLNSLALSITLNSLPLLRAHGRKRNSALTAHFHQHFLPRAASSVFRAARGACRPWKFSCAVREMVKAMKREEPNCTLVLFEELPLYGVDAFADELIQWVRARRFPDPISFDPLGWAEDEIIGHLHPEPSLGWHGFDDDDGPIEL